MKRKDSILGTYNAQKLPKVKIGNGHFVGGSLLPNIEFLKKMTEGGQNAFHKRIFEQSQPEYRVDPILKFNPGGEKNNKSEEVVPELNQIPELQRIVITAPKRKVKTTQSKNVLPFPVINNKPFVPNVGADYFRQKRYTPNLYEPTSDELYKLYGNQQNPVVETREQTPRPVYYPTQENPITLKSLYNNKSSEEDAYMQILEQFDPERAQLMKMMKQNAFDNNYFFNGGFLMPAKNGLEVSNDEEEPRDVKQLKEIVITAPKKQTRNVWSYLNPWNWGVNDYSKYRTFSGAYENAKRAGEKEFMWGNKRFPTTWGGTDAQEMDQYGITSNQRTYNPSMLRERLGNLNTINGYATGFSDIMDALLGKKLDLEYEGNVSPGQIEQDAFRLYLGLPQNNKSFIPSRYNKNAFEINNYSQEFPEILAREDFEKIIKDYGKSEKEGKHSPHIGGSANAFKPWADLVMGKHTIKYGQDKEGEYVEYNDKWDLDSYKISPSSMVDKMVPDRMIPKSVRNSQLAEDIYDQGDINFKVGQFADLANKPFQIQGRVYYKTIPGTNQMVRSDVYNKYTKGTRIKSEYEPGRYNTEYNIPSDYEIDQVPVNTYVPEYKPDDYPFSETTKNRNRKFWLNQYAPGGAVAAGGKYPEQQPTAQTGAPSGPTFSNQYRPPEEEDDKRDRFFKVALSALGIGAIAEKAFSKNEKEKPNENPNPNKPIGTNLDGNGKPLPKGGGSPVFNDSIVGSPEARGAGSYDTFGNFNSYQGNMARLGGDVGIYGLRNYNQDVLSNFVYGGDISIPNLEEGNWLNKYNVGGQTFDCPPGWRRNEKGKCVQDEQLRKDFAQKVVDISKKHIKDKSFFPVPQSLLDTEEGRTEGANGCIGGVCEILKEAGVLVDPTWNTWSNTTFADHAKESGFPNAGIGLSGSENLQPGDVLTMYNKFNTQNHVYPGHSMIFLYKDDNNKYHFFDNYEGTSPFGGTGETIWDEEKLKDQLDLKNRTDSTKHSRIFKVNPYTAPDSFATPEAKQAHEQRARNLEAELYHTPRYEYELNPESDIAQKKLKVPTGMTKVIDYANSDPNINKLIQSLHNIDLGPVADKAMIHDSIQNVFGILGQENKWENPWFGGNIVPGKAGKIFKIPLETTIEKTIVPASFSVGPGQIKFNELSPEMRKEFGIERPRDLHNWDKLVPLMVARDLENKYWMMKQGKDLGLRISGEPASFDELPQSYGYYSPYFWRGLGLKVKTQATKDFEEDHSVWDYNSRSDYNDAKAKWIKDNAWRYAKTFDKDSYGRNVQENVKNYLKWQIKNYNKSLADIVVEAPKKEKTFSEEEALEQLRREAEQIPLQDGTQQFRLGGNISKRVLQKSNWLDKFDPGGGVESKNGDPITLVMPDGRNVKTTTGSNAYNMYYKENQDGKGFQYVEPNKYKVNEEIYRDKDFSEIVVTAPKEYVRAHKKGKQEAGSFQDFARRANATYPAWYKQSNLYNPERDLENQRRDYANLVKRRSYQNFLDENPQQPGEDRIAYQNRINSIVPNFVQKSRGIGLGEPFQPGAYDLMGQWSRKGYEHLKALPGIAESVVTPWSYQSTPTGIQNPKFTKRVNEAIEKGNKPVSGLTEDEAKEVGVFQPFESLDRAALNKVFIPAIKSAEKLSSPNYDYTARDRAIRHASPNQTDLLFAGLLNPAYYIGTPAAKLITSGVNRLSKTGKAANLVGRAADDVAAVSELKLRPLEQSPVYKFPLSKSEQLAPPPQSVDINFSELVPPKYANDVNLDLPAELNTLASSQKHYLPLFSNIDDASDMFKNFFMLKGLNQESKMADLMENLVKQKYPKASTLDEFHKLDENKKLSLLSEIYGDISNPSSDFAKYVNSNIKLTNDIADAKSGVWTPKETAWKPSWIEEAKANYSEYNPAKPSWTVHSDAPVVNYYMKPLANDDAYRSWAQHLTTNYADAGAGNIIDAIGLDEFKNLHKEAIEHFSQFPVLSNMPEREIGLYIRNKAADKIRMFTEAQYNPEYYNKIRNTEDIRTLNPHEQQLKIALDQGYDPFAHGGVDWNMIDAYTRGSDTNINGALRGGLHPGISGFYHDMSDILNTAIQKNKFTNPTTVRRGINSDYPIQLLDPVTYKPLIDPATGQPVTKMRSVLGIGDVFKDESFISSSINPQSTWGNPFLSESIRVPGGGKLSFAYPEASRYPQFQSEYEAILPKGLIRRVAGINDEVGQYGFTPKYVTEILNPYKTGGANQLKNFKQNKQKNWLDNY